MTTLTRNDLLHGKWEAKATARFWEPGVEEWTRERLYLPEATHITGRHYDQAKVAPYATVDGPTPGNRLVSVGLSTLFSQLIAGTRDWSVASAGSGFTGLAVGTGTTPDAIGDTDLGGGSKSYRVCDNTFPLRFGATHPITGTALTQGQMLFATTYASGEANFSWDEYAALVPGGSAVAITGAAVTTKPTNYVILNRKSPAGLGIKANGAPAGLYLLITVT